MENQLPSKAFKQSLFLSTHFGPSSEVGKALHKECVQGYVQSLLQEGKLPQPLYHGTGTYALSLSAEARQELLTACDVLIRYLFPIAREQELLRRMDATPELFGKDEGFISDAYNCALLIQQESNNFEYRHLYMTPDVYKAADYATRGAVCGEQFYIAYWLYEGIRRANASLPPMTEAQQEALQLVLSAAEAETQPIVLRFPDVRFADVVGNEQNTPIDWKKEFRQPNRGISVIAMRLSPNFSLETGEQITLDQVPAEDERLNAALKESYSQYAKEQLTPILRQKIQEIDPENVLLEESLEDLVSSYCNTW